MWIFTHLGHKYSSFHSSHGGRRQRKSFSGRDSSCSKCFVNHLLLVDEVGCLHDQVHQLVCVVTPGVQVFQRVLLLCEVNNSLKPVSFCRHCSRNNHVGKTILSLGLCERQKSCHSVKADLGVVLRHHPDIMFDHPCLQVGPSLVSCLVP